jgi:hypothetical protein
MPAAVAHVPHGADSISFLRVTNRRIALDMEKATSNGHGDMAPSIVGGPRDAVAAVFLQVAQAKVPVIQAKPEN